VESPKECDNLGWGLRVGLTNPYIKRTPATERIFWTLQFDIFGGKAWPARQIDNPIAIYEPIV
jgi:hypothetical protein